MDDCLGRITAEPLAVRRDLRLGRDLAPVATSPQVICRLLDGAVWVLDQRLAPVQRLPVLVPPDAKLLTATADPLRVVVRDGRAVSVATDSLRVAVDVATADSATILPGGRLLVTAPVMVYRAHRGRVYEAPAGHLVYLVDVVSGRVLDRATLDVDDAIVIAVRHPYDGSVVLEAGMGQDGSMAYLVRTDAGALAVQPIAQDVVVASFNPSGDRLLVLPHPSFDKMVSVLSWPDRRLVARLRPDEVGLDDDAFDFYGCFLSDGRILLMTHRHGPLLCQADLRPVAWVDLDLAGTVGWDGEPELSTMVGLTEDTFAVDAWDGGVEVATVWRVPQ